jgi:hypothetical protein
VRAAHLSRQERAFLQSVVYASLFDYPVTSTQLCHALIGEQADEETLAAWYAASPALNAVVESCDGYYFPRGRRDLLAVRQRRERVSRQLLDELASPLTMISALPFVRMVALSGSLAHLNGDGEADLDLFIITAPRRVWSVTLTALVLARLCGWRKRLCVNYVVSERELMVAPADLFSANQIVHLQPLEGEESYRRFLAANRFVRRFYPNFRPRPLTGALRERRPLTTVLRRAVKLLEPLLDWTFAPTYERLCRLAYSRHLRSKAHTWRSRDQVRMDGECLKLHTSSHRHEVMERFEQTLEDALQRVESEALTHAESAHAQAVL